MISVAFVVYGKHTDQGKIFHQYCLDNPTLYMKPIDIRRILHHDPLDESRQKRRFSVDHKENGTYTKTQVAMLDDPHFYEACLMLWNTVRDEIENHGTVRKVIPVHCTQGQHRADTTVEAITNKVLNVAYNQAASEKMFNAKAFKCNSAMKESVIEVVAQAAEKWLKTPFCIAKPSDFGEGAREAHERARSQLLWLEDLHKLVETEFLDPEVQSSLDIETCMPLVPIEVDDHDRHEPSASPATTPAQPPPSSRRGTGGKRRRIPYPPPPPLRPPSPHSRRARPGTTPRRVMPKVAAKRPAPCESTRDDSNSEEAGQQIRRVKRRELSPDRRKQLPGRHGQSHNRREPSIPPGTALCPCCNGCGHVEESIEALYDEGRLVSEPTQWVEFLLTRGADNIAAASFETLASAGNWGYDQAMRIIQGICKREAGAHPVRNISGYLVSVCKDAWHS